MARGRKYIPAVWDPAHAPGTSPKVSGGHEVDLKGNIIPTRGFNRPDQRYAIDPLEAQSRRAIRADEEAASTAIYTVSDTATEVRTSTGNFYRLNRDATVCSCPDAFRLLESYPDDDVSCKHRIMVFNAMGDGGFDDLPWGSRRLADYIGCDKRTVEAAIRRGELAATLKNNVWLIDPTDAVTFGDAYRAEVVMIDSGGMDIVLP